LPRTLPLALLLATLTATAHAVPLPSRNADARALLAALPDADREAVLAGERVVTFEELRTANGRGVSYLAVSLAVLDHAPRPVRGLFTQATDYPTWIPLSPTYKEVRVAGGRRIACRIGKSTSRRARETLTYDVAFAGPVTTWSLTSKRHALLPGSTLAWEVVAIDGEPDRSLVIHRQSGHLSGKGRLSSYLDSSDKQGRNRYWKDANKHARRLHWAMDAALSHPPGQDREARYLDSYASEFGGAIPYWAK
jgi:hypothetical protein